MKRAILSLCAFVALVATAQSLPENSGLNQLDKLDPVPGKIDLSVYESGLMSLTFDLPEAGSTVNADANVYAILSRDGKVLANVQACNYKQVSYDNIFAGVWQLSFFLKKTSEALVPGNYQVVIEKGFFLLGEDHQLSEEIVINYYIPENEVSVVPAQGTVASFQNISITYPGVKSISRVEGKAIDIYNIYGKGETEDEVGKDDIVYPEVNIDGNVISLILAQPVTKPGTWRVSSEDDALVLEYPDGSTQTTGLLLTYVIPNFLSGLPEINPEPGEVEYFPGTITLTVPRDKTLFLANQKVGSYIYPVDENGNRGADIARYQARKSQDYPNTVELIYLKGGNTPDPEAKIVPAPGKYQLVTGEKLYSTKDDNKINYISSMTFDYTVYVYEELPTTITPPSGSEQKNIKTISFRFDDAETVEAKGAGTISWLQSETTNYLFGEPRLSSDDPKTVIYNTPIGATIPGTYKFTSGAGQLVINGISMVMTADYKITGDNTGIGTFENVVLLPEIFDIYNTQGVLIKKNANVDYLQSLPAGVYVAGGKKYINR